MSLEKISCILRILINLLRFKKEFYIILKLFITRKIFFIKIGASETSITNDVLAKFINLFHCKGVLIEPNPIYFNKIKEKYSRKFTCLKLAISNRNGSRNFFTTKKKYLGSLSITEQNSLLRKSSLYKLKVIANLKKKGDDKKKFLKKIKVKTLEINSLLNNYKNTNLLFIDTEGHDYFILEKLNLKKFNINTIIFENRHIPGISLRNKLIKKFKKNNYKLIFNNFNESIYQKK
jgi:FkbM family methyltransferase